MKMWLLRTLATLCMTALVAWGVSFKVSDNVVEVALRGYDKNVETLNQNVGRVEGLVTRLDGGKETSNESLIRQIAELQRNNSLLEERLLTRFDSLLNKIESADVAIISVTESLSDTADRLNALDTRQRKFEQLVLANLLNTTDPSSYKKDWYNAWGIPAAEAAALNIDPAKTRETIAAYIQASKVYGKSKN